MKVIRLAILAALVAAAGCVKMNQEMTINKDGSGTMTMNYGMSEQMVAQMEAMQAMGGEDADDSNGFDFDVESIKKDMSNLETDGIKLKDIKSVTKDGWRYIKMDMAFKSLEALSKTEYFGEDSGITLTKNDKGNYVLEQKPEGMGGDASTPEEKEQQKMMMNMMAAQFKGMEVSWKMTLPGKIIESNADKTDGNTVSWKYSFDESGIDGLMKLQEKGMKVVFSGKGVKLPTIGAAACVGGDDHSGHNH